MGVMTGLSGNEIYCLRSQRPHPRRTSHRQQRLFDGLSSAASAPAFASALGGEVTQITNIIHEGRQQSYARMVKEAQELAGRRHHRRHQRTAAISRQHRVPLRRLLHSSGRREATKTSSFSTSGDGQELYCQFDAGYTPMKFVFGNVAYSIGIGGGILGALKSLGRGEIKEFSNIFNSHPAFGPPAHRATKPFRVGANAVVGIETTVMPFSGVHEMMMMGTASHNPVLPPECCQESDHQRPDLRGNVEPDEHGLHARLKLVLGTAVYSLGIIGGLKAMFKSLSKGEIHDLTSLIYDAREHAIGLIADEATAIGADDVVGIKTHIHEMGGLIEFMAIGTAVKRFDGLSTQTDMLPPQAIIKDKDTWVNYEDQAAGVTLESSD